MALTDHLEDAPRRVHGIPCSVGAVLERLDEADRDALKQMLGPLGFSAPRIFDALKAEGYDVGLQTINRHRSGACRCFRSKQ